MTDAITVTGLRETQKALRLFSQRLADRVIMVGLRAGANFMLKQVRSEISSTAEKTGRLRRATSVGRSRFNTLRKNGKIGLYVRVKKGKKRDDLKGAYYAGWIEKGFRPGRSRKGVALTGGRRAYAGPTQVPGKRIFKRMYNQHQRKTAELAMDLIEQGGIRLLDEIGKRR